MTVYCSKCNECFSHVNIMVEGGITYHFCDDCYDIAKDLTTNFLEIYCRKTPDYVENKIKKAKEKREKGQGKWQVDNKDSQFSVTNIALEASQPSKEDCEV